MSHYRRAVWAPTRRLLAVLAAAALASACGGGGGDSNDNGTDSAAASAEGFYVGTLSGGTANYFEQLVLENNEVWIAYGTRASATASVSFSQPMGGIGTYSGGTLTVAALKDYGIAPAASGTFSASYKINSKSLVTSVSGSANAGTKSLTLSGDNNISNYRYAQPATLAAISGTWSLPSSGGTAGTLSIASNGGFSFNFVGCTASGTMAARASGKNVYNVALTLGPAPCGAAGVAFSGIAYVASDPLLRGDTLRLLVRNSAQTSGLMLLASR